MCVRRIILQTPGRDESEKAFRSETVLITSIAAKRFNLSYNIYGDYERWPMKAAG